MATPISPLYTVTEQYLDAVEKGQRIVLDLVEKSASKINDVAPAPVNAFVAKLAPKPADLARGYALVARAVSLQQDFTRELTKALSGSAATATPAKPKRAA